MGVAVACLLVANRKESAFSFQLRSGNGMAWMAWRAVRPRAHARTKKCMGGVRGDWDIWGIFEKKFLRNG